MYMRITAYNDFDFGQEVFECDGHARQEAPSPHGDHHSIQGHPLAIHLLYHLQSSCPLSRQNGGVIIPGGTCVDEVCVVDVPFQLTH